MTCHWYGPSKTNIIDIDELFKIKAFNDEIDTKNKFFEKQDDELNANSTQIDKYMTVNVEDQAEDVSMDPENKTKIKV